jgi:uncharacterized protein (TIGR02687 family)
MNDLTEHLRRAFEERAVVVWHDPDLQYSDELDDLRPDRVEVLRVEGNEFAVKHRVLRRVGGEKYLVYRGGPVPDSVGNWLLDVELVYGVFSADRGTLLAQDLGLTGADVVDVLRDHENFFRATKRTEALRALIGPDDEALDRPRKADRLRAKMCAVVLGQREHTLQEITRTLLIENAGGTSLGIDALSTYGLDTFFWAGAAQIYGYVSEPASVNDFVLWLFKRASEGFTGGTSAVGNLERDFSSWRFDTRSAMAMAALAQRAGRDLGIARQVEGAVFRDLLDRDVFVEYESAIVVDLAREAADRTVSARDVANVVRQRRTSPWFTKRETHYEAIAAGAEVLAGVAAFMPPSSTLSDGLTRYRDDWFRLDQAYRRFTRAAIVAEPHESLAALREAVERAYTTSFVLPLGQAWQAIVEEAPRWYSADLPPQTEFFTKYVAPLTGAEKKAAVIVSDGLRYEIADELAAQIRKENRFEASTEALLGVLPSYTQLGMAALLPHTELRPGPDGYAILADGRPTQGTEARAKILADVGGTAITYAAFKALSAGERRELYRDHKVLYVFHNRIDATGDKADTERLTFEEVKDAQREIVDLVKMLHSANAYNIFITADHGFLYQDDPLPKHMFLSEPPDGGVLRKKSRFVIGRDLRERPGYFSVPPAGSSGDGDVRVQIAKSVHRLSVAGSGTRYVHGGAALQEIVIPVIKVNKQRSGELRRVGIELRPETDRITTSQLAVLLHQTGRVGDKVSAQRVRLGLYAGDTLISDQPEIVFDSTSEDRRDWMQNAVVRLTQDADDHHGETAILRVEVPIEGTAQWRVHTSAAYRLQRTFAADNDGWF